MAKTKKTKAIRTRVGGKTVETIQHTGDKRKNIPSAEHQSVIEKAETAPHPVKYLRNTDLDPQLVWRGKDEQDWTDLVVQAPPLYIQERVHPKVLVDDLLRQSKQTQGQAPGAQFDLFGDFNGIREGVDRTEFYRHDQNWSNRMILGDSLQVMASLAEREGLRGKVQCIYIDPPYGIKFNSNFQWSTTSRDVKDGKTAISEFPKGRKYRISLSFLGKSSVRPAQVGRFDVNIVIHGSTAVRGRGDLVAYGWALWKLPAPWTHRTRPPHLGKRCAFSTSFHRAFPIKSSTKNPERPQNSVGKPG